MNRRYFFNLVVSPAAFSLLAPNLLAQAEDESMEIETIIKSDEEWLEILTPDQFHILREEGTEPPFSSPLNREKRQGTYVCAGCRLSLFASDMKYDSGTGWPSFFTSIEGHLETKLDFRLIIPRTEYHCARCSGHQGHVFNDGPRPTGKRWCNNGLALAFVPDGGELG